MRIAIHTGHLLPQQVPLLHALLEQLAAQFASHQWLITGQAAAAMAVEGATVQPVAHSGLPVIGTLQYKQRLLTVLRRWQPDVVLQCDSFLPWLPYPQLWVQHPCLQPALAGKRQARQLSQCTHVAIAGEWQTVNAQWPSCLHLHSIGLAPHPAAKSVDWASREQLKQQHSGGQEFFLHYGPATAPMLLALLKAYSQFRKRQHSSMPLLIALPGSIVPDFEEKLASYKYRSDVHLKPHCKLPQWLQLSAAAYAVLLTPACQPWQMLSVLKCDTALLTPRTPQSQAACGPAANLLPHWDEASLAQALMLIYKDETYRNTLLNNGRLWLGKQQLPLMAHALEQALQTTCEK